MCARINQRVAPERFFFAEFQSDGGVQKRGVHADADEALFEFGRSVAFQGNRAADGVFRRFLRGCRIAEIRAADWNFSGLAELLLFELFRFWGRHQIHEINQNLLVVLLSPLCGIKGRRGCVFPFDDFNSARDETDV